VGTWLATELDCVSTRGGPFSENQADTRSVSGACISHDPSITESEAPALGTRPWKVLSVIEIADLAYTRWNAACDHA
jgi:hypothetical protein